MDTVQISREAHDALLAENTQLKQSLAAANEALNAKERQVSAFLAASQAVLQSASFDEIAREIFDIAIGLIGATSGYIALLSDDGTENDVLFLEAGGRPCSVDPSLPMPIRGLRAEAYSTMKPVYDNDFMNSNWVKMMPAGHVSLDNVMFAPLNVGGKTVGIMGIANKPGGFSDTDADKGALFGELAAIALQRVHMLELSSQLEAELKRSNEELTHFAYTASHDLREPLRTITSFAKLLDSQYHTQLDTNGQEYVDFITDGADRMTAMINGLLTYSRLEIRGLPFEAVDMNALMTELVSDLTVNIEENEATVTWDSLPEVHGDQVQLRQLMTNLVNNAIKFHGDTPPVVHVGVTTSDAWQFSVADNGVGFDSEAVGDQIFTMFNRLQGHTGPEGSGIGLAICKRIVTRHGGKIWASASLGQGATLHFTLPKKVGNRLTGQN